MKNFIKTFIVLGITVASIVSCDSRRGVTEVRVYRAPDGVIYRRGEIYTMGNGDVYRNGILIRQGPIIIVDEANLPPGQMKKIYRTKSAKEFAPGQQKKKFKDKKRKHRH